MASLFPGSKDTFTNPVYTKINGEDVVNAAHINDLQDAIRATQEVLAGVGLPLDMISNNYIADNSSFKMMVEALDQAIGSTASDLASHKGYVLATDPTQHHANVIEITPLGNLSSDRAQAALYEHQNDIDHIMTGGSVEGISLDNRYLLVSGAQTIQGPLTISTDLIIEGNTLLGNDVSDLVTVSGELTVGSSATIAGNTTIGGHILVQPGAKIAENGATDSSFISLESDNIKFYSHRDIIFRLDADDTIDGNADNGLFIIKNGLDNNVFTLDEAGNIIIGGDISSINAHLSNELNIGNLSIQKDKILGTEAVIQLQLDKDNLLTGERFHCKE